MSVNALHMINKYGGYFHDGSIHQIKYQDKEIIISMERAELLPEWYWDRVNIHSQAVAKSGALSHLIKKRNNSLLQSVFILKQARTYTHTHTRTRGAMVST